MKKLRHNTEEFFNILGKEVRPVGRYFRAKTPQEIDDMFPKLRNSTEGGHLLFRPMGLKAFVEIVCSLYEQRTIKQKAYNPDAMHKAIKDAAGLPLELSDRPAVDVVWVNSKIAPKNFLLLKKVFRHMLGLYRARKLKLRSSIGAFSATLRLPCRRG